MMRTWLYLTALLFSSTLPSPAEARDAPVLEIANAEFERVQDPKPGKYASCVTSWLFAERAGDYALTTGTNEDGTRHARVTSHGDEGRADLLSPNLKLPAFTEFHVSVRVKKKGATPVVAVHPTFKRRQVDLTLVTGPDDEWFDVRTTLVTGVAAKSYRFTLGIVGTGYVAWDALEITQGKTLGPAKGTILILDLNSRAPNWKATDDYWLRRDFAAVWGYDVEVWNYMDATAARVRRLDPVAIVLGPAMTKNTVSSKGAKRAEAKKRTYKLLRDAPAPTLGICLGCQWLGRAEGVPLRRMGESGDVLIERIDDDPIFAGVPERYPCSQSHKWGLKQVPPHFEHLGQTKVCKVHVIRRKGRKVYGFQGHFERGWTTTTPHGRILLDNFIRLADPGNKAVKR